MSSPLDMLRVVMTLSAVVACGAPSGQPSDAGSEAPPVDAGFPGPHPAPPQVVNQGGLVLAAPRVVPVFFAGDAYQTQLEDFFGQLSKSTFWGAVTSEYGVGALTVGDSIVTTDAPPASIDAIGIEAWLADHLDGAHAGWPAGIDSSDVLVLFYPASTTIADPSFGTSCTDFNGFHDQGAVHTSLVYAVVPRCASAGNLTGLDALTAAASHELVEAATDPLLQTSAGWAFTDADHLIWSFVPGAEVADMCALQAQSFERLVGPYVVQRSWSNASALAGHDPCVPPMNAPYFNAAPSLTHDVDIVFQQKYTLTKGLQLAVGQSKTVDVQLFSDAPTSDWSVTAVDTTQPPGLTFVWDAQTGNNGDTLHLTITRTAIESSEFAIEATSGGITNLWFGFVAD